MYEESLNLGVTLDIPAYESIFHMLVVDDRLTDAIDLLHEISDFMRFGERTYFQLLHALVQAEYYEEATELLKAGRQREVQFTSKVYDMTWSVIVVLNSVFIDNGTVGSIDFDRQ